MACIGAYGDPWRDPTPVFLAQHLPSKSVTIVDYRDEYLRLPHLEGSLRRHATTFGDSIPQDLRRKICALDEGKGIETDDGRSPDHGLWEYRLLLRWFKRAGLKTGIKLMPDLSWDTGLRNAGLVVDRDTAHSWISHQGRDRLKASFEHYLDLVGASGRVLVMARNGFKSPETKETGEVLEEVAKAHNARIQRFMIRDSEFPILGEASRISSRTPHVMRMRAAYVILPKGVSQVSTT